MFYIAIIIIKKMDLRYDKEYNRRKGFIEYLRGKSATFYSLLAIQIQSI